MTFKELRFLVHCQASMMIFPPLVVNDDEEFQVLVANFLDSDVVKCTRSDTYALTEKGERIMKAILETPTC